jgi:hypothetical protein
VQGLAVVIVSQVYLFFLRFLLITMSDIITVRNHQPVLLRLDPHPIPRKRSACLMMIVLSKQFGMPHHFIMLSQAGG